MRRSKGFFGRPIPDISGLSACRRRPLRSPWLLAIAFWLSEVSATRRRGKDVAWTAKAVHLQPGPSLPTSRQNISGPRPSVPGRTRTLLARTLTSLASEVLELRYLRLQQPLQGGVSWFAKYPELGGNRPLLQAIYDHTAPPQFRCKCSDPDLSTISATCLSHALVWS